jgi:hypothetical protein
LTSCELRRSEAKTSIGAHSAIATAASSTTFAIRRTARDTGSGAMNSADRSARSPARLLAAIIGSRKTLTWTAIHEAK